MSNAFIKAAELGDTDAVLRWIREGTDINVRDAQGRTAILAATEANQAETVGALIEAGADINLQDHRLFNPFLYAGAHGLLEIVKLLIDAGADPAITNRYGGVAIIPASEKGHVEVVRELLTRSKVNVNHVNNLGWTALLEAILLSDGGKKHQQIIRMLIEHGADVHIPDKDGVTPLMHARALHYTDIEKILLSKLNERNG